MPSVISCLWCVRRNSRTTHFNVQKNEIKLHIHFATFLFSYSFQSFTSLSISLCYLQKQVQKFLSNCTSSLKSIWFKLLQINLMLNTKTRFTLFYFKGKCIFYFIYFFFPAEIKKKNSDKDWTLLFIRCFVKTFIQQCF